MLVNNGTNSDKSDQTLLVLNEIKSQVTSFQQTVLNLQDQVSRCHDKIDLLSVNPDHVQELQTTQDIHQDKSITRSEDSVLPGLQSYSQVVEGGQDQVNDREKSDQNQHNERSGGPNRSRKKPRSKKSVPNQPKPGIVSSAPDDNQKIEVVINRSPHDGRQQTQRPTSKRNILLMGDSILNKVNTKGLTDTVHKHSVSGATLQTLIRDIELYDIMNFETVIIYIGGNDLSGNSGADLIEESYEQLIAMIQSRNSQARIVLCKLAPRGDADVTVVNRIIERLSVRLSVDFVDNYQAFFDRQGKLIMRYFGQGDQIHPSVTGVRRILGTINKKVEIVNDFAKSTFHRPGNNYRMNNGQSGFRQQPFSVNNRCLKCYDSSHETYQCRHKSPVICWFCGLSGHKSEFCWN